VHVQVVDLLVAVAPGVDDGAEAVVDAQLLHQPRCQPQHAAEQRVVLGFLLTWMAERRSKVFLVATANQVHELPAELLRKVKAAQYVASHPGEVCPAKWKEGEKTLKPSLDLVGKI